MKDTIIKLTLSLAILGSPALTSSLALSTKTSSSKRRSGRREREKMLISFYVSLLQLHFIFFSFSSVYFIIFFISSSLQKKSLHKRTKRKHTNPSTYTHNKKTKSKRMKAKSGIESSSAQSLIPFRRPKLEIYDIRSTVK